MRIQRRGLNQRGKRNRVMHTKARLNLSFRGFNLKSIATHYVQRVVLCDNAQVLKLTVEVIGHRIRRISSQ